MVRLAARRVRGRLDGERDDGRGDRRRGRHAAGPDGYASLLRLQHGGLFWSLAGYGEENTEAAEDFSRQLVPQRRGWKVPVAGVRRKRARAEVDIGAHQRPRAGVRNENRRGFPAIEHSGSSEECYRRCRQDEFFPLPRNSAWLLRSAAEERAERTRQLAGPSRGARGASRCNNDARRGHADSEKWFGLRRNDR